MFHIFPRYYCYIPYELKSSHSGTYNSTAIKQARRKNRRAKAQKRK